MYFLRPTSSSIGHSVSMQNSGATRHISPVRRHTTVGVPLNEISLSSSWLYGLITVVVNEDSKRHTNNVLWKHFSTNTSSSRERGICRAIREGLKMARARTIRSMSFFSKLSGVRRNRRKEDTDVPTTEMFHKKVISHCVVVRGGHTVMDAL